MGHEGLEPSTSGLRGSASGRETSQNGGITHAGTSDGDISHQLESPVASSWPNENPRQRFVLALLRAVAELTAVGDLAGARVAHEALGKLLAEHPGSSNVADLEEERQRWTPK